MTKLTERILRALRAFVLLRKWTDLLWWTYLCVGIMSIQAMAQLFGRVFLDPTLPLNIAFYEFEISIYVVGVVFIICAIVIKRYLDSEFLCKLRSQYLTANCSFGQHCHYNENSQN